MALSFAALLDKGSTVPRHRQGQLVPKKLQGGGLSGRTSLGGGSLVSFISCAPVPRAHTALFSSARRPTPAPLFLILLISGGSN